MEQKKPLKKLSLNKETVRQLDESQLQNVAGGTSWITCLCCSVPTSFCKSIDVACPKEPLLA